MDRQSQLKNYKSGNYEYLYLYFKYKNQVLRVNTKMKYVDGMHKKDLSYSSKMKSYQHLNLQLSNLKREVDKYIMSEMQHWKPNISQKNCTYYLKNGRSPKELCELHITPTKVNKTVLDFYDDFYKFKQKELTKPQSLKDYKTLKNSLIDFQVSQSTTLLDFSQINSKDFFFEFRNFLSTKHKGKTQGHLNDNTVQKRMSTLKTFMRWVEDMEYFTFKAALYRIKFPKYDTFFVTLSRGEIQQMQDLEIENSSWKKITDIFIANCFMSLRFNDLSSMEKGAFVTDEDGDVFYTKTNEKTGKIIEIPLVSTALDIFRKYDFVLPKYCNQYFNRELQKILTHYELFSEIVKKTTKVNGAILVEKCMKRKLITSHTCRRTFITNAMSKNVSYNNIQSCTGHSQLRSLQGYVKRISDKEQLKAID